MYAGGSMNWSIVSGFFELDIVWYEYSQSVSTYLTYGKQIEYEILLDIMKKYHFKKLINLPTLLSGEGVV